MSSMSGGMLRTVIGAHSGSESTTELPYWASIKTEVSDDPNIRKLDQLTIRGQLTNILLLCPLQNDYCFVIQNDAGWKITSPVLTSLQLSLKSHHVTSIM